MIKIWGRNTSVNVQKVMWALGELGVPHERIDVGGSFGKNNEPAYLAMNPNGLVPTLEEDGFLLWESNSIVRYLAAKFGAGSLEPADLRARARASSWMDWQHLGCGARAHAGVLGPHSNAAGKARCRGDRSRQGQEHGRDENSGCAARQEPRSSPATRSRWAISQWR